MSAKPAIGLAGQIAATKDAIAALRAQIARLQDELDTVSSAPVTLDEAHERLAGWVDGLAKRFESEADLGAFFARERGPHPTETAWLGERDPLAMLAFANPGQLKERLTALLERDDPGDGIEPASRPARLKQLDAKIQKLGLEEESLIRSFEEAGIYLARRADANPEIVLAE